MKSVIRNFRCTYLLFSNDSCVYNSFGGVQQDLEPIVLKFQSHCLVAAVLWSLSIFIAAQCPSKSSSAFLIRVTFCRTRH